MLLDVLPNDPRSKSSSTQPNTSWSMLSNVSFVLFPSDSPVLMLFASLRSTGTDLAVMDRDDGTVAVKTSGSIVGDRLASASFSAMSQENVLLLWLIFLFGLLAFGMDTGRFSKLRFCGGGSIAGGSTGNGLVALSFTCSIDGLRDRNVVLVVLAEVPS